MGIRNPFTSTDYISISLTTGDGTYDYDLADACTNA